MKQKTPALNNKKVMTHVKNLIAPAWPLKDSVAVNPFHGYSGYSFEHTAHLLKELAGIDLHMPLSFYEQLIAEKKISQTDLREAMKNSETSFFSKDILSEIRKLKEAENQSPASETITELAENISHLKLNNLKIETISNWASTYFSEAEKILSDDALFSSWRTYALVDYSTHIIGLKQFRFFLKQLPAESDKAFEYIVKELGLQEEPLKWYLLKLAYRIPGWSAYIAGIDWDCKLYGGKTNHIDQFICILLCWEFCIYQSFKEQGIQELWKQKIQKKQPGNEQAGYNRLIPLKNLLQTAFELATQRELREKFNTNSNRLTIQETPEVQAIFCIDVRSEVYRRNLEAINPRIQTIGFAGFFGFPVKYRPAGTNQSVNQCPVLLPSGPIVKESVDPVHQNKLATRRIMGQQTRDLLKQFKSGAISSFGFVSSLGLFFLPKLLSDSFHLTRTVTKPEQRGYQGNYLLQRTIDLSEFTFEEQLNIALATLKATGLNQQFAPIVLLTGHGSSTVNNPHAAGLECGACGGHSGDVNALVAATVFNNPDIRNALTIHGIHIPKETIFLAGLHDTATDQLTILNQNAVEVSHQKAFNNLVEQLELAATSARKERSIRLRINPGQTDKKILQRSKDWAQVRPEWGLAGCNSFVVAPRTKTKALNLGGKAFLHDYDFTQDTDLNILTTIMTAPMVVTTWINLQYYASTTDNKHFGAGDKTLHNVTSGIGVIEGSAGDLRIGLPLQSIHNGNTFEHLPQRLNVIIDAPVNAINEILAKHETIRNLFDNQWIHLFRLNKEGVISDQYISELNWKCLPVEIQEATQKQLAVSA